MCELGERLKKAREAQGLDLATLARRLKIRRTYLEALETCRFNLLPEPVLARAYLKRYARALGLDPTPLLALLPGERPRTVEELPRATPRHKRPWWLWFFIPLVLLAGWLLLRPSPAPPPAPAVERQAPSPPPPHRVRLSVETEPPGARVYLDGYYLGETPLELKVEAGTRLLRVEAEGYAPVERRLDLAADRALKLHLEPLRSSPPSKTRRSGELVLKVRARSWIRVTTPEGKRLYEGTAKPGETLRFPLPVVLRTGNAGGLVAVVNGQELGPLGEPGEVLTRRFP